MAFGAAIGAAGAAVAKAEVAGRAERDLDPKLEVVHTAIDIAGAVPEIEGKSVSVTRVASAGAAVRFAGTIPGRSSVLLECDCDELDVVVEVCCGKVARINVFLSRITAR